MSSLNLVRWGSLGLVLAGVVQLALGFLIAGVGPLAVGVGGPVLVLFIVALLLTAMGLVGLHALQKGRHGLIGRVGFYTILVAITARVLGALVLLSGSTALMWLIRVGFWAMVAGFALYGAATVRARALPRWYGVLLIIFVPLAELFGRAVGNMWEGLVLLLVGYVLWLRRDAAFEELPRT